MLTEKQKKLFKETARELKKEKRRRFQARITQEYLGGSARKAESHLGWCRKAVGLGLREEERGITCLGSYSNSGRKKTEEVFSELEKDIRGLVDRESQTDPKFQTNKKFCKITAVAVIEMLEKEKGYEKGKFCQQTMNNILNRQGYHLKKR